MRIYLDYAATTPVDPRVADVVDKATRKIFGNPSSAYNSGREAKKFLENSRQKISAVLGCASNEIIFTGSGTESDNLAIIGAARAYKKYGKHIIVSAIEHFAVLKACQYLEKKEGFEVTYLPVNKNGIVEPDLLTKSLRRDTILVSIMYANNEIGTIQPILKISKILKTFRKNKLFNTKSSERIDERLPLFHTDACQAAGALDINVQHLGVDTMTLNGSKIYGPKATGCLYLRRGARLEPIILGGSQERGLRAGTENPALMAGFTKALQLADKNREKESKRLIKLRDYLIKEVLDKFPSAKLNGDPILRLPNNVNISFSDVDGEMLLLMLDERGIEVSTGSACTTSTTSPSHVITALQDSNHGERNLSRVSRGSRTISGNLRITLGHSTTKKDLNYFLQALVGSISKLVGL